MKIDNNSRYGVEVWQDTTLVTLVKPFSSVIFVNGDNYKLVVNKQVVSSNTQPFEYVTFLTNFSSSSFQEFSTQFNGQTNVSITNSTLNTNITNSVINTAIQGEVNVNVSNSTLNTTVEGTVNVNIENTSINVAGNVGITGNVNVVFQPGQTVNIGNTPSVSIESGTVTANISNAEIKTDIVTAKLGTNNLVNIGQFDIEYGPTQTTLGLTIPFEPGLYDSFLFSVVGTKHLPNSDTGGEDTFVLPIVSLTVNGTEYRGVPCQNSMTLSPARFAVNDNSKGIYQGSFATEEPIDTVYLTVTVQSNWWNAMGGWATASVTMNAWNSNSFKNRDLVVKTLTTGSNLLYSTGQGALDIMNGDLIGVNAVVLNDSANAISEGILFPKSTAPVKSTAIADYDTLRILDGKMYMTSDIMYEREFTAVSGVDLNALNVNRTLYCVSPTNRPSTASAATAFVRHYQRDSGYKIQWYETSINTFEIWVRRCNAGTWEAWKKITMA
jgi:hypothetical protein